MTERPELEAVHDVLNLRILGQTIKPAEVIRPGGPIVVRDLTGQCFGAAASLSRAQKLDGRGRRPAA